MAASTAEVSVPQISRTDSKTLAKGRHVCHLHCMHRQRWQGAVHDFTQDKRLWAAAREADPSTAAAVHSLLTIFLGSQVPALHLFLPSIGTWRMTGPLRKLPASAVLLQCCT